MSKCFEKGKVPTQGLKNNLTLEDVPFELKDLRPLETRLLCLRIPFMKLVALPKGGQMAIHGSAVNVPSKLQPIATLLPRLPDAAEVIPLKLKRKLVYDGHYMHEYVRPQKVMAALKWLKQNNPHYKDVDICLDWVSHWQKEEPDLWNAMVTPGSNEAVTDNCLSDAFVSRTDECQHESTVPQIVPNASCDIVASVHEPFNLNDTADLQVVPNSSFEIVTVVHEPMDLN